METKVTWHGDVVGAAIAEGAVEGLNEAAYEVQQRARRATPKKTGTLRDSLELSLATQDGLEAAVYSSLDYAVYQHEIFSYSRRSGQPKFLEGPALKFEMGFRRMVANAIKSRAR